MTEPTKVKFDLPDNIPELQFLCVLEQVADLFASHLSVEEMTRVVICFNSKYNRN